MKDKYIVQDCVVEQTGGYVYVAWGSFLNKELYFAISSEILIIYDADEYKAMEKENYDGYEWEQKHEVESFSYLTDTFKDVLEQVYLKCDYKDKDLYDLFGSIGE